ncbi:MAG: diguanylate cyclase [Acidobacteria bacterium]|nr:diguanylate cyclase [Acidobacteriota bacterium]
MASNNKHIEKAERLLQKGKVDAALAEFLIAWKEEPNNDALVQTVAELYLHQKKIKECRQCYGYLFDKYAERQEGARAVDVFQKMRKLGPVEPKRSLACAQFLEKKNPKDATGLYRQVLDTTGGQSPEIAIQCLQGLSKLQPDSLEVQQRTAALASKMGNTALASSAYQKAAEMLSKQGKDAKALEALEQVCRLSGNNPAARLSLAQAYAKAKKFAPILELLGNAEEQSDDPQLLSVLADACRAGKQLERAEAIYWKLLKSSSATYDPLLEIALEHIRQDNIPLALRLLDSLKQELTARRRQNDLLAFADQLGRIAHTNISFLEFLCKLLEELHYDSPLFNALNRLFDLYFAAGQFPKATDLLHRLIDLDSYDPQCAAKLDRLEGKADPEVWNDLATRLGKSPSSAGSSATGVATGQAEDGGNVLDDLILQAEIYVQYKLDAKARERLERIAKLFPREEEKNDRLRNLFTQALFAPKYPDLPAKAAHAAPAGAGIDLSRVSGVNRNLFRQGTVKKVLFAAVNDVGRLWQADRCVVGLGVPGRPPSMVLEYISPSSEPSDPSTLGKLVMGLQQIIKDQSDPLVAENAAEAPPLAELKSLLAASQVKSLAVIPLRDADQPTGILVLEQCSKPRSWGANDLAGLEAIAGQIVLALSNARLRSLMKTLAVTDERSGLLHRDSYLTCLLSEAERMSAQKTALTAALLQFSAGGQLSRQQREQLMDQFMKKYAGTLASHLRQSDIAIQYSKDTLALIMPGTNGKNAVSAVEKLRKTLSTMHLPNANGPQQMRAGIGQAVEAVEMDSADIVTELINRLECALEDAKQLGGNGSKLLEPPELSN